MRRIFALLALVLTAAAGHRRGRCRVLSDPAA